MTGKELLRRLVPRLLEIGAVAAVALLGWNNYSLRGELQHAHPNERPFSVRDRFRPVPVVSADGTRRELDLSKGRVLVAILNPSCSTCEQTLADLARQKSPVVVVGARNSRDLPAFAKRFQLASRAFTLADTAAPKVRDRFTANPQILVVDEGEVVRTCKKVSECV